MTTMRGFPSIYPTTSFFLPWAAAPLRNGLDIAMSAWSFQMFYTRHTPGYIRGHGRVWLMLYCNV